MAYNRLIPAKSKPQNTKPMQTPKPPKEEKCPQCEQEVSQGELDMFAGICEDCFAS